MRQARVVAIVSALLVAGAAVLLAHPALAARPFVTDDARITAPHACQRETWGQIGPEGNEYWAVPACNFTGNLELSAGLALLPNAEGDGDDGGVRGIWGLAGEFLAVGPLFALAEIYGTTHERPFSQLGMRLWLVPEYVQLDTTYGIEYGAPTADTYWVSIGLRLLSPPLY